MTTETRHLFKSGKHTPKLSLDGKIGNGDEALISGEHVRVYVDCRENFGDPMPLARLIAGAPELLDALNKAIAYLANPQAFDEVELGRDWFALKRKIEGTQ